MRPILSTIQCFEERVEDQKLVKRVLGRGDSRMTETLRRLSLLVSTKLQCKKRKPRQDEKERKEELAKRFTGRRELEGEGEEEVWSGTWAGRVKEASPPECARPAFGGGRRR